MKNLKLSMILDADNIMKEGCLESVNAAFQEGANAVQCHRTAKNQQTSVAVLDAISEEINNHLFRKGPTCAWAFGNTDWFGNGIPISRNSFYF